MRKLLSKQYWKALKHIHFESLIITSFYHYIILSVANVLPHRKAMPQTQDTDTPSRHSIQTKGRPVVVLSIDVERHTGIHNYPF